ncbi:hypothetical protein M758_1G306100 [Ceratodon purpureus]|nr:hypothetical protein M758_1G306100 [Ceratodon purpureus]
MLNGYGIDMTSSMTMECTNMLDGYGIDTTSLVAMENTYILGGSVKNHAGVFTLVTCRSQQATAIHRIYQYTNQQTKTSYTTHQVKRHQHASTKSPKRTKAHCTTPTQLPDQAKQTTLPTVHDSEHRKASKPQVQSCTQR